MDSIPEFGNAHHFASRVPDVFRVEKIESEVSLATIQVSFALRRDDFAKDSADGRRADRARRKLSGVSTTSE